MNTKHLGFLVAVFIWSLAAGAWLFALSSTHFLTFELSSDKYGSAQVFWDTGSGFSEDFSARSSVNKSRDFSRHYFRLADKKIYNLRLDPIDAPNAELKLRSLELTDGLGRKLYNIDLKNLDFPSGFSAIDSGDPSLVSLKTNSADSIISIRLASPLSWRSTMPAVGLLWCLSTFILLSIFAVIFFFAKGLREIVVNLAIGLGSVVFAIGVSELGLKAYMIRHAVSPSPLPDYADLLRGDVLGEGGFLKENLNGFAANGYGGKARWVTNNAGFRSEIDFQRTPPAYVTRILFLGDSFVAGYRVDQQDAPGERLRRWAEREKLEVEVLSAAIEFPDKGLEYLKKYGLGWHPKVLLIGVTLGNDIAQDFVSRSPEAGGFTTGLAKYTIPDSAFMDGPEPASPFTPAGILSNTLLGARFRNLMWPSGSSIISWYGSTHAPRLFDPLHGLGFYLKEPDQIVEQAFNSHFAVLDELSALATKNGIKLAIVLFPQRFQVQFLDWSAARSTYHLDEGAFDLMLPNKRILNYCESKNLLCIDATLDMRAHHDVSREELYFPRGDMHLNAAGNSAWFEAAKEKIRRLL